MATSAQNSNGDASANVTSGTQSANAWVEGPCYHVNFGPGIFIRDEAEYGLYVDWLYIPHPELELSSYLTDYKNEEYSQRLETYAEEQTTHEQKERFARVAQCYDICLAQDTLWAFKKKMEKLRNVLETEKEDAMADFDPWDFKQMEKETRDASRKC